MSWDPSGLNTLEHLAGYRVLIVEDLAKATDPDCVLLEIDLHGERAFGLADELHAAGRLPRGGWRHSRTPPRVLRA